MEVEAVLSNSLHTDVTLGNPFNGKAHVPSRTGVLIDQRAGLNARGYAGGQASVSPDVSSVEGVSETVQMSPREVVKRRNVSCHGMTVEIVQATGRDRVEYRYRSPFHMLVAYEQGVRREGDTFVQGLPKSTLRDIRKKLTFVPAGHEYREVQDLQSLSRITFFYFDPAEMPVFIDSESLTPRLYFEEPALWDTALKLTALIESASGDSSHYLEALGIVLAHELARLDSGKASVQAPVRGGLAAWQQRIVSAYIEEHLSESIPLATLAQLARLSTYHFCRAFKQSFGIPPHRFHTSRRIERAKALLAKAQPSVTDIGLTVGFSQTSSFTAAFRRATGVTPTGYHRSLG
jgi:AraC family transcriptional regulator